MFHDWDSFFLLIGSAAGALIGLLFVVVTLTAGQERSSAQQGQSIFITPTVFHFAMVMVVSAVALTPGLPTRTTGLLIGGCAIAALINAIVVALRMFLRKSIQPPHWSDYWYYGVAPVLLYALLVASAACVWPLVTIASYAVGVVLLLLLLLGIRNAWDLVTWIAPRAADLSTPTAPNPDPVGQAEPRSS